MGGPAEKLNPAAEAGVTNARALAATTNLIIERVPVGLCAGAMDSA
jgi:hypothetical protein